MNRIAAGAACLGMAVLFIARAPAGERILGAFTEPGAYATAMVCLGLALLQFSGRIRGRLLAAVSLDRDS